MSDQQATVSGRQGVTDAAASEIADVGKALISGVTPADKGWILGFVIVVFIIVASDVWISIKTLDSNRAANERLVTYFIEVEQNRAQALDHQAQLFGDQVRRSQEVIRALAETVSRDSERAGMAAVAAIDQQTRQQYTSPQFIGPPEAPR